MIFQISGLWCSHWKWKMQYILLFFVVYIALVQHNVLCCTVCKLTLTAPTGNVTSPCYPQLYPNNQDCKWILQAPKGFIVQLTFVDFDVEEALNCVYDYLSISNGETTTKYCGVTARGLTYNSTGNMMNISFFSDFSIQRKGFNATYKHVPVTLRNLKVTIPQNQSLGIVSVASTVLVPVLSQFTVCFEATRFMSSPAEWKAFTYWNSLTEFLSFGKTASGHFVHIHGIQCPLNLTLSSLSATGEFFTETLQEMCITWDSRSQLVGVKTVNTFQTSTCLDTKELNIPANGSLILGCYDNKTSSLQGDIYNFRLWDTAFDSVALSNLSCDQKGNIVNWENDFWSIPSWARKAGTDLSCGTSLSSTPSTVTTTCKNLGGVCQATAAHAATKQKPTTTATTATTISSTVSFNVSSTVTSNVSSTIASTVTSTISTIASTLVSSIAPSTKTSTMPSNASTVSSAIASSLLSTVSSTISSTSSAKTSNKSSSARSSISFNLLSNGTSTKSSTAPSTLASPLLSTDSSTISSTSSFTKTSSKSSSGQALVSSNVTSNGPSTKSPTSPSTKMSSKSSSAQSILSSNLASNGPFTNSTSAPSNDPFSKSSNVQNTVSSTILFSELSLLKSTVPSFLPSTVPSSVSSAMLSKSTKESNISSSILSTLLSTRSSKSSTKSSTVPPVLSYTVPLIVSSIVSSTVPSSETSSLSSSSVRSTDPSTLSSTIISPATSYIPVSSTVHSLETSTLPSAVSRTELSIMSSAVSSILSSAVPYTTVTSTVPTLSFTATTTLTTATTTSDTLATISTTLQSSSNSITASSIMNATASPSTLSPTNSFDRTTNYSSNSAISSPSTMITINMNDTNHINNSQPGGTFYRISITVVNNNLDNESEVQRTVSDWLKQSLQNWSYAVFVLNMSIYQTNSEIVRDARSLIMKSMQQSHKRRARDISNKSFDVWALLVYNNSNNVVLETKTIYDKLLQNNDSIGDGLSLQAVSVYSVEPCMAEEYPSSYFWPSTRPTMLQIIPCPKNSAFNASRKCSVGLHNYSSYWEIPTTDNCTDSTGTEDAENVANGLLNITGNGQVLTSEKVDQVVQKLKQIVNDANISASLGSTVVNVFSNLLSSPDDLLAKSSSDALKTIETLALKVQFTGSSVSILSPNLALGVSRMNSTSYTGSVFSVGSNTSSSEFEINMENSQNSSLASVVLPSSLLSNLSESDFYTVSRAQFTFFNKSGLFQDSQITSGDQTLISYVVSCSIGNITIKNLADPVKIIVKHKAQGTNREKTCVFWDTERNNGKGGWNTYGCTVLKKESSVHETVCLCNHLTHFGILMDLQRTSPIIDQKNTRILTFITYIGCGISAICTAATLLTYIAFEKIRRDYPSKILMNLSTALLFLNLFFLLDGWIASFGINELCITVAVLLHFFLLATFTWMGLEAVHMYIALVKVFNTYIRRYMLKFCIIGWGLPAIIVSVVLASTHSNIAYGSSSYGQDSRGNGGDEFCWIKSDVVFYVTCAAYFAIMFLMNVAMFIVVMVQICGRNGKRTNRSIREEVLRNLRSVVSLTFLLGMTWGFAFFAWGPVNLAFMYLFTIFNSLQGLFIFVFHCALKENVQKQWRRHLCCGKLRLTDNSDWSKTATNNTKKVSSDNLGKSLSSSSIGSNSTYLTSKSKSSNKPFFKRNSSTDNGF